MSSSVEATDRNGRIVVGVDGATGSLAALRWAVAEARLRHATVEAVIAWAPPQTYGYTPAYPIEDFQADAAEALSKQSTVSAKTSRASSSSQPSPKDGQRRSCLLLARRRTCWSWGRGGTAGSPECYWAR